MANSTRAPASAAQRLIVALDVDSPSDAKSLVDHLGDAVTVYKVGLAMQMLAGNDLTDWLLERGKRVFLDLKYDDIPNTVEHATRAMATRGVAMMTVSGHGNPDTYAAAVAGAAGSDTLVLAVTVLTSISGETLAAMGFPPGATPEDFVLSRARTAKEAGCDGLIMSGKDVGRVRAEIGGRDESGMLIVTPGIRPGGASLDDHARATTPAEAIKDGADYLVVGRPIYQADNPREIAEKIIEEIEGAG